MSTRALLLCPEFSPFGFWNYKTVCRFMGAKYPAPPLGLITMAALLPTDWELRLLDLNTTRLRDADIDAADLVFIGGMLPQQPEFLRLIDRVHARGKRVVGGGPDPTSQPDVYESADYLVLGEAERSLPRFLQDLERGATSGRYLPEGRPEMSESPVPRFDLLDFSSYLMVGVQFSRGCPFSCEFCDIIELYGRKPRTKTPEQIIREFEVLRDLGYRGHVDFVDDNFVGHKGKAKRMLTAVKDWSASHGHPFFFSTEASIDLADDEELLGLMRDVDFRYVFVGIESPDEQVLLATQKRQNVKRDLMADLRKFHEHGMVVNGGFILGFDAEQGPCAESLIGIIEAGKIVMAMVGLLFALPNTQLSRRLETEGRLFAETHRLQVNGESVAIDQTTDGLNFATRRARDDILKDLIEVLGHTYSAKPYFDRCLKLGRSISVRPAFKPPWRMKLRYARAFQRIVVKLGLHPRTAWYFWRNIFALLFTRVSSLETVVNLMAMYAHFGPQTRFVTELTAARLNGIDSD